MSEYFNNIFYGVKSFLTGMKLTLSHFKNKKELVATLQYPHEKWPVPERNIGFDHAEYNLIRSRLHVDIDDCIACMQCEKACPVDCIKIDSIKPPKDSDFDCGMTSNDTQKKMIVSRFTIDMSECMYCNLCVFPCPEECIYMVGGPNASKHEIDYEFSQYERDGMIFEFADATDEQIKEAGGEKWIEQRDAKINKHEEGIKLEGEVKIAVPPPVTTPVKADESKPVSKTAVKDSGTGELEIKSFNSISDKMCRGIAKKTFTAAKRAGKDQTAMLSDIAQALSDMGKMTDEIQTILDGLPAPVAEHVTEPEIEQKEPESIPVAAESPTIFEMDLKDLNGIEDKMARGIAKKAFIAAKRAGEDKVEAVKNALEDAGKLDTASEALLSSFTAAYSDSENLDPKVESAGDEKPESGEQSQDLPLFDIKDLNSIDEKMARGMAKKIYTAGKRAEKSRSEVIRDIKAGLSDAGKLDSAIEELLNRLETGS
ncbi:MAG: 4Fe-4S binding protein [Candidatus Marinimicrobia bacterium]|nr:4Fe-4S binding protein [Candidatus Neomarinimicrobiota bacterium]